MIADGSKDFSPVYTAWLRKPLVLLIAIRRCHVSNPCSILGESAACVFASSQERRWISARN
jgi:hypothetical protein